MRQNIDIIQVLFSRYGRKFGWLGLFLGAAIATSMIPSRKTVLSLAVEDCANGVDDDEDGLIDLNDTDCICKVAEPIFVDS
ncbi:MAG: hypothetical protein HC912_02285 [Saprospiraceae bacterium]|nr:hypothetical protein [Saprospiraceae bacterium]